MIRLALAAILLASAAGAAPLPLRPQDEARLGRTDTAAGVGLRDALAKGSAKDIAALTKAMAGPSRQVAPSLLAGDWSCRTIKTGGPAPLVVYQPFRCRVTIEETSIQFQKLTGSQRVRGEIIGADDGTLVLLGVGYIAGDTPPAYADLPARIDPSATPQRTANPGVIEYVNDRKARILFPEPTLESRFDILELTR